MPNGRHRHRSSSASANLQQFFKTSQKTQKAQKALNEKLLVSQGSEVQSATRSSERCLSKHLSETALSSSLFKRAVLANAISASKLSMPHVPLEVPVELLKSNGLLISDEDSKKIFESTRYKQSGTYSPRVTKLPFEMIRNNGKTYIVYHEASLGEGGFGKILPIQNLETAEFEVLKIPREDRPLNAEVLQDEVRNLVKLDKGSPELLKDRNGIVMNLERGMSVASIYDWELNADPDYIQHIMHPILRLHMATEIVKAVMKFHEDKRLIHGDINAGNILLDLFRHKAGIVDFADVMSPNTSRRIRGNPIYFDSDLRNHLLRQGRVREAHLPTYHAVGHFTFKSDSYAVAIVVSQLMIMFMYPEQNIPETWDINDTHVLPDLDDIWEGKPRAYFDKVLTAIHEMTNESRQKRPTLKVFLEKLEAIKQQYITDTDFSLDTSLFDVDYYLSLSDEEQSKMLKDVACRHEVVLVDTKKNLLAKYFANKHKDSNTETKLERELLTYLTIKRKLETLKPNSLINLRVSDEWIAPTGDFDLYSGKLVEANRLIDENIEKIAKAYLNERQSIPFKISWERKQSLSDLYNTEMQKMDASFKCC